VIRHVLVNRACIPNAHPAMAKNCARRTDEPAEIPMHRARQPGWLAGEPPEPTGQPKHALPAGETGKQANAPAGGPTQPGRSRLRRKRPRVFQPGRLRRVALEKRCRPSFVTPTLALVEALLGLQQPMRYQQPAQQVIQGLAGGSPLRIAERPSQERIGSLSLLRGHPPRVLHPPRPLDRLDQRRRQILFGSRG
jgi:hypothetical protein